MPQPTSLSPLSPVLASLRQAASPLVSPPARREPAAAAPDRPPLDHAAAARHWIEHELSVPVPADSPFPDQVMPGWQLNFDNLCKTFQALAPALEAVVPAGRESANLHDALKNMPERLVEGTQRWYRNHAPGPRSHISREQFNLLVVDDLRRVSRIASDLAANRKATPAQREGAARVADLFVALKRLHYSSNVQALYEASGKRLLPMLDRSPEELAPGYRSAASTSIGARGGVGMAAGASATIGALLPIGFTSKWEVWRPEDHDFIVEQRRVVSIGPRVEIETGVGPHAKLGSFRAGIDIDLSGGNQIKAPRREQVQLVYGEQLYAKGSRLFPSASSTQRQVIRHVMNAGNSISQVLFGGPPPYDPDAPLHASKRKQQKGLYGEDVIQDCARSLDMLAGPPGRDGATGAVEALLRAAYPTTRQRIEAMPAPDAWTAPEVGVQLSGPNPTQYGRMGMNAPGTSRMMRAPTRSTSVQPSISASFGPTQAYGDNGDAAALVTPSFKAELELPTLYHEANNYQLRLVPLAEQVDVSKQGDFAPSLKQLELACRLYDAGHPFEGGHPHLLALRRLDAMAGLRDQAHARLSDEDMRAGLASIGLDDIYGDPKDMAPAIGHAILALREQRLSPVTTMNALQDKLESFARIHAAFIADSTEAWARRGTTGGAELLERMNQRLFDGAAPLPRDPGRKDFTAFFERANDALSLAFGNLTLQFSVAQREIERLLQDASPAARQDFKTRAGRCAAICRAQTALMSAHRLPVDKQDALRASSLKSAARITSHTREQQASVEIQLGLFDPMSMASNAPGFGRSRGAYGAAVSFESRLQNSSVNPELVGRFLTVSGTITGDDFLRQFAVIASALREANASGAHAGKIPHAVIDEVQRLADPIRLMTLDFKQHGLTWEAQWRLPPDDVDAAKGGHGAMPPLERALQFVRITERDSTSFEGSTPNLLAAAAPGMLKISAEAERSVTRTLRQENGICPASNILEWNGALRQRFVDAKTGARLDWDAIERELAQHPGDAARLFSRFNPVCLVPQSFAQAVRHPDGPRNEFHRLLHGAEHRRQREHALEASRFDPASASRLFEPLTMRCELDPLAAEAQHWEPADRDELKALARMSVEQRAHHFLGTDRGRAQMERYIRLMEAAVAFNNRFKTGASGYVLSVDRAFIASRRVTVPPGTRAGGAAADGPVARARRALGVALAQPAIPAPREARPLNTQIGLSPGASRLKPPMTRF